MEREGLDGLLATSKENVYYLSGVQSLIQFLFPWESQVYALVSRNSLEDPYVVIPTADVDTALEGYGDITIINYGLFYKYLAEDVKLTQAENRLKELVLDREPEQDAYSALVKAIKDSGLADKTVGFDQRGINPDYIRSITEDLPNLKLKPATSTFMEIRLVKTPEEINRLRIAVQITEKAIQRALNIVKEGITEIEVAKEFEMAILDQGARPNIACHHFGRNIAFVETKPWDSKLKHGDLIWFDVGCFYEGYASDISRVFALGDPGKKAIDIYKRLLVGWEAGIEVIRHGAQAKEIFQTSVSRVRESGMPNFERTHVGHGIGLEIYDPPLLGPENETVIERGMVLNLEIPYYEIGFGGFNIEDTIVVTDGSPEFLTSLSTDLVILE
jgi:Xaa-Pro aminopeptidase